MYAPRRSRCSLQHEASKFWVEGGCRLARLIVAAALKIWNTASLLEKISIICEGFQNIGLPERELYVALLIIKCNDEILNLFRESASLPQ